MLIALPRTGAIVRSLAISGFFLGTAPGHAQETPLTPLGRQLARIDFSVNGAGEFTKYTSGPDTARGASNYNTTFSLTPSNTLGAVVTLRYIKSSFVGLELNYGYARYSENYANIVGANPTNFTIQTNASEYTAGYVVHIPHPIFGLTPFAAAGAGTMGMHPTAHGGEGLNTQARAAYYYAAGVEEPFFNPHFGLRAQVRQVFFLAPDFGQNYLTNLKRTSTFEPAVGFYLHF